MTGAHRGHCRRDVCGRRVDDRVGGDRDSCPLEHGAHVRLVHRHLQGGGARPDDRALVDQGRHQGEIDLFVIEGDNLTARREVAQLGSDEWGPEDNLGRHLARGIVGMLGQHGHRQAKGTCSLACHPGQLSRSDEPDVMRGQLARSCRRIRIDSGADTSAP